MTEQEFNKQMSIAINECVDDVALQQKRQLQNEEITLSQNVQRLQNELNECIGGLDYQTILKKENELSTEKRKLEIVSAQLASFGEDDNLVEIDYERLKDIHLQVRHHYMAQIKEKCKTLNDILVQVDAIRTEIMTINHEANKLFSKISNAYKNPLQPANSMHWDFMSGETSQALNTLLAFAKKYSE